MNIELSHPKTIAELLETAEYFGKDTKRKKSIFFKKWIADCDYIIESIESQLKKDIFAWHLGQRYTTKDLNNFKAERSLIEDNFLELIN
jgi:hypothetical protein